MHGLRGWGSGRASNRAPNSTVEYPAMRWSCSATVSTLPGSAMIAAKRAGAAPDEDALRPYPETVMVGATLFEKLGRR